MSYRWHFAIAGKNLPLCNTPSWYAKTEDAAEVTCRRCLFFLGRYMPTDHERREELIKRQDKLTR